MLLMLCSFYGCFLDEDFVNKDTENIRKDQDRDGFSTECRDGLFSWPLGTER